MLRLLSVAILVGGTYAQVSSGWQRNHDTWMSKILRSSRPNRARNLEAELFFWTRYFPIDLHLGLPPSLEFINSSQPARHFRPAIECHGQTLVEDIVSDVDATGSLY